MWPDYRVDAAADKAVLKFFELFELILGVKEAR